MVGGGIREFMNNADGPAFLERELVGLGVDGYRHVKIFTLGKQVRCSRNV